VPQAPPSQREGQTNRLVRLVGRPYLEVPEEILQHLDAFGQLRDADCCAHVLLERNFWQRFLREPLQIRSDAERHLVGELGCAHVGRQTLRQVYQSCGEFGGGCFGFGGGMTQLPSHLPVGLQDFGAGKIQCELLGCFYRLVRQDWLGLRVEDGVRGNDQEEGVENRGRISRNLGLGGQGSVL
jgi:hypothetical protein